MSTGDVNGQVRPTQTTQMRICRHLTKNTCLCTHGPTPDHCGRHLGKINGHKSTNVKVWRCTFCWITMFYTKKTWVKLFECQCMVFGDGQFNLVTDRATCHRSLFQAYKSPCIFERRAVTSPTTLVSKVHHCNWDYHGPYDLFYS